MSDAEPTAAAHAAASTAAAPKKKKMGRPSNAELARRAALKAQSEAAPNSAPEPEAEAEAPTSTRRGSTPRALQAQGGVSEAAAKAKAAETRKKTALRHLAIAAAGPSTLSPARPRASARSGGRSLRRR